MDPEERMEAAITELINSKTRNFSIVAKKWDLVRTTLSRRFYKQTRSKAEFLSQEHQLLTTAEEDAIFDYIERIGTRGLHLTPSMLVTLVEQYLGRSVSKNWVYGFEKRNNERINSVFLYGFDKKRHLAESAANIDKFYTEVSYFSLNKRSKY